MKLLRTYLAGILCVLGLAILLLSHFFRNELIEVQINFLAKLGFSTLQIIGIGVLSAFLCFRRIWNREKIIADEDGVKLVRKEVVWFAVFSILAAFIYVYMATG